MIDQRATQRSAIQGGTYLCRSSGDDAQISWWCVSLRLLGEWAVTAVALAGGATLGGCVHLIGVPATADPASQRGGPLDKHAKAGQPGA